MVPSTGHRDGCVVAQLMVGPEQVRTFGGPGILACLDYALKALDLRALILSVDEPSADLARTIVRRCAEMDVPVFLWTMVFADRHLKLSGLPFVQDARGRAGYGSLGAWAGLGKGDERFLFHCPSALGEDEAGVEHAVAAVKDLEAQGLFLDRIRYPSPANGLEFLSACSCPRCRKAFSTWSGGEVWPDLATLAIHEAARGSEGAGDFGELAHCAFKFRAELVERLVSRYAEAARSESLSVGLDLFAPSLAPLVGQDYGSLARHADFVKPMLYCKAFAPAGLPLEFTSLVAGLVAGGVEPVRAREFVAALTGLDACLLEPNRLAASGFPASLAASELLRCRREVAGPAPEVFAGVEFVEHSAYATKIDDTMRDAYLESLAGQDIAVCWNILYVPRGHIDAVASRRGDRR